MSEALIVEHCSPTMAGLKTGSLFSCKCTSKTEVTEFAKSINRKLVSHGLVVLPLSFRNNVALIYVYRPKKLREDMAKKEASAILSTFGYSTDPSLCVSHLAERIKESDNFPHEIGLFLGYPPQDVQGFLLCKPCKFTGYWKVYENEEMARQSFARYEKCKRVYRLKYLQGVSIEKLTVCL